MSAKEKKYITVKKVVLKGIRDGSYQAGQKLPTEDEIMAMVGFSRSPVRHALLQLEQEGHIYRIHGSGSFVKQVVREEAIDIYALLFPRSKGIEKDFIHGMRQAVNNSRFRDLHLILKKPGENLREMIEILQSLDTSRPGGLIIVPVLGRERAANRLLAANLRKLETENFIVVQLDRNVPEFTGNCVMADHLRGAHEMVSRLIARGHRRIAVMYEHPENSSIKLRLQGVRECLKLHNLSLPESLEFEYSPQDITGNAEAIVGRLRANKATALFCFESEIALEMYKVFAGSGIAMPADISLCCFDEHSFTGVRDGFITAVLQPLEELGYFAVDLILRKLEQENRQAVQMVMEPTIIERESLARV